MTGRIAVGVSGTGSNLRALAAAVDRGDVPGRIVLVFADRACPALDWAAEHGLETALVPAGDDTILADVLGGLSPDAIVLAGYMRIVGPAVLAGWPGRILNTHPSLLPAFPGAHAVDDALAHGVAVTGCTVHLVDATLDGGPIVAQEAVPVLPGDDAATLHARIRAVEHRLLPAAVGRLLVGGINVADDGRHAVLDLEAVDGRLPIPRRALLSVSDKTGLADLGRGLVARRFELVSTGGTARTLREAGLPVTDVASVTGSPEMLDGRVKTLHPRVHAGLLADRRLADHRGQLLGAWIAPFELVVVNLYPFAAALERPGITVDELIEEIDIGGPSMVRAAAKNHANVAIVTAPSRYGDVLAALDAGGLDDRFRRELAVEAFAHTAAYDARIAADLPRRLVAGGLLSAPDDPYPPTLTLALEKVETLRYGENPHQPAARYRRPGATIDDGPFGVERVPLQGKALSYNNILDAAAASAIGRALRGPAVVIVKHTNPCGAAERATLLEAWTAALEADPVSAFGGVVALTGPVDRAEAEALTSLFLEIVVAPSYSAAALEVLATKPNLRVLLDERLSADAVRPDATSTDPTGAIRTAGGAVLVTSPDVLPDDPAAWSCATRRTPTVSERSDLDLAWRLVRAVTSNAIVLVQGGLLVGIGSGQTSRVDAAHQAVAKAHAMLGEEATLGASCASDAFFPFPDAVEACLAAGVTAFVQPGGSVRDRTVVAAADAVGATMLLTGTRHFRH